ncbi:uncharacterized protein RCC_09717 [Ramularia collo-cygni]|uniref:Uncharacterized protein n=1 Tax=Ramularia collo-cygni TaxID=112498 RepID=A0A2D3VAM3_9PEZI|nr:uncharacterized protein RCC_09717 [Ramularia collo-cygni]CZT24000.1 uncharacterized protein RCC_09717 [Ramularia collo-cygni]
MSASALARLGTPPRTPKSHRRHLEGSCASELSEATVMGSRLRTNTTCNQAVGIAANNSTPTAATALEPPSTSHFNHLEWNNMVIDPRQLNSHTQWNQTSTTKIETQLPSTGIEYQNVPQWNAMANDGSSDTSHDGVSFGSNSSSNSNASGNSLSEKTRSEMISQLTHLSSRLDTLYSSKGVELSYTAFHSPHLTLFDDACYRIVAGWFVYLFARMQLQVPSEDANFMSGMRPTGDILHSVFSASHCLLDVLRALQRESIDADAATNVDLWTEIKQEPVHSAQVNNEHITSYFQNDQSTNMYQTAQSRCPSTVLRQLVVNCHTQTLNIYVIVLIALQHDAAINNSQMSTDRQVEDDTRLALVVQLCADLLERERQAVDLFLTRLPPSSEAQTFESQCQTMLPMGNGTMMGHLEIDVQQRLARIQQMLRL